jgi:hypothetical protein
MTDENHQAQNTDKLIWREHPGDFYSDAIYVTQHGEIAIDCGGMVFCLPVRGWHQLARDAYEKRGPKPPL